MPSVQFHIKAWQNDQRQNCGDSKPSFGSGKNVFGMNLITKNDTANMSITGMKTNLECWKYH